MSYGILIETNYLQPGGYKMSYQVVLFDADDTLFDFSQAEAYALNNTCSQFGLESNPNLADSYRQLNQQLWDEFEKGLIDQATLRVERFNRLFKEQDVAFNANEFSQSFVKHLSEAAFIINGAVELCNKLLEKGIRIAIITNGIKEVQHGRISRSELANMFEHIIISEDAKSQKPHPEIFDYAFQKLNLTDKNGVLIVGDSLSSDIRGGMNYNIDTCWYNPKSLVNATDIKPTYEIAKLDELLHILGIE